MYRPLSNQKPKWSTKSKMAEKNSVSICENYAKIQSNQVKSPIVTSPARLSMPTVQTYFMLL